MTKIQSLRLLKKPHVVIARERSDRSNLKTGLLRPFGPRNDGFATISSLKTKTGKVTAVSISKRKGTKKYNIPEAILKRNYGIIGDAHAGSDRQISLLAEESIEKMRAAGLDVSFGDFGENISTEGIDLTSLPVAARIKIGEDVVLEITQIGKKCISRCDIYNKTGACIMPKEGVFAKVLKGGVLKAGSRIEVLDR